MLPVLAVDLVSSQGVVKHQDLMGVLQSWSGVVAVLKFHRSIQQREVPPDDQSVRAVCGGGGDIINTILCSQLNSHTGSFTGCVKFNWLERTGDVADECGGEDSVQHQAGKMSQLEQRHEDVDGGQWRAERLQLHHLLQPREELLLVGRAVTHPAEREHQLLDHLRTHVQTHLQSPVHKQ